MTARKASKVRRGRYAKALDRIDVTVGAVAISEERWNRVIRHLPVNIPSDVMITFRQDVLFCCSRFQTDARRAQIGSATFAAVTRAAGTSKSPMERLLDELEKANRTLAEIGEIYDDHRGAFSDLPAQLPGIISDLRRRTAELKRLPKTAVSIRWPFIRSVADACRRAGLNPTATGRIYDAVAGRATWFQRFIAEINDNILGVYGWGSAESDARAQNYSTNALYADIAKALAGYKSVVPAPTRK